MAESDSNLSTIDKSHIIRAVIKLLPREFQKLDSELDLMDIEERLNESALNNSNHVGAENSDEDDEEKDERIQAGCFLWDLSVLQEQALFLYELQIVPIIVNIIQDYTKYRNRLVEVCIGILANITCVPQIAEGISNASSSSSLFSSLSYVLLTSDDSLILNELLRLINVCISHSYEKNYSSSLSILPVKLTWLKWFANDNVSTTEKNTTIKMNNDDSNNNNNNNVNSNVNNNSEARYPLISQLLLIMNNTLNETLLEQAINLVLNLLFIKIDSSYFPSSVFAAPDFVSKCFIDMGLVEVILNLLNESRRDDSITSSDSIIDLLLRILESFSVFDYFYNYINHQKQQNTHSNISEGLLLCLRNIIQFQIQSWSTSYSDNNILAGACIVISNMLMEDRSWIEILFQPDIRLLKTFFSILQQSALEDNDDSDSEINYELMTAIWNIFQIILTNMVDKQMWSSILKAFSDCIDIILHNFQQQLRQTKDKSLLTGISQTLELLAKEMQDYKSSEKYLDFSQTAQRIREALK